MSMSVHCQFSFGLSPLIRTGKLRWDMSSRFHECVIDCGLIQDIDDDTIIEGRYICVNEDETKSVKSLELLCILNLASCYQKTEDWKDCIRACDHAIQIEPSSTKAYYRRAQVILIILLNQLNMTFYYG